MPIRHKTAQQTKELPDLQYQNFDATDIDAVAVEVLFSQHPELEQEAKDLISNIKDWKDKVQYLKQTRQFGPLIQELVNQIRTKKQEYDQTHDVAEQQVKRYEEQEQTEQWEKEESQKRSKTSRAINDDYLQSLNIYTLNQLDIQRVINGVLGNLSKNKLKVDIIVNPDFSVNYSISNFIGQGLTDQIRQSLQATLNRSITPKLIAELKTKMAKDNRFIEGPVQATLFNTVSALLNQVGVFYKLAHQTKQSAILLANIYWRMCLAGIVEDLKKKHPHLSEQIDFFIQRDPTKKYLAYEVKILASGQALEGEIADVIELFHKFKDKLEKKDINQWNFTELRDKLFELRDFGDKSKTQQKKKLKEEIKKVETTGAEKLYEDDQCELVYVANKAQACFYGYGTKWCISMENDDYLGHYQGRENAVFYYVLRKDLEPTEHPLGAILPKNDPYAKVAIKIRRDMFNDIDDMGGPITYWLADDSKLLNAGQALPGLPAEHIASFAIQDAPKRPMSFLATLKWKPNELSFEDYAANLNDHNKSLVATKANNPKILALLANDADPKVIDGVAYNTSTPPEILRKIYQTNQNTGIVGFLAMNESTPSDILYQLSQYDNLHIKQSVAANINSPLDALQELSRNKDRTVQINVATNVKTPEIVLRQIFENQAPDIQIFNALAGNPSTPLDILLELAKSKNPYIRSAVDDNSKYIRWRRDEQAKSFPI